MLVCKDCGAACERRSPGQRYCRQCSAQRDLKRKAAWARGHKPDAARRRERVRARVSAALQRGAEVSLVNRQDVTFPQPDISRFCVLKFPFDYALSKNAAWRNNGKGHVYLRDEARQLRERMTAEIATLAGGLGLVENRVWIGIKVEKPDFRGDAINFVDAVCDAVKVGLGIDDRWFSLMFVDWSVVKIDPRIMVYVGQENVAASRVCSSCGRILPYDAFGKSKHARLGIARACRECSRKPRAIERVA